MKKLLLSLLMLPLACINFVFAQQHPGSSSIPIASGDLISQGSELYDSSKYRKAIEVFSGVDRNDTNYIRALYNISMCYYADTQYDATISYCKKALAASKALNGSSLEPDILNEYGNALDAGGHPDEALRLFDSALSRYPANSFLR